MSRSTTRIQNLTRISSLNDNDVIPLGPSNRGRAKGITFRNFTNSISNRVINIDLVSDLIADASLNIGNRVVTAGYLKIDDNGGNNYEIVAAGTGIDDGGSFIDLTTFQAKAIFDDNRDINIKQFGAVGDDATDDIAKFDNAIAFLQTLEGGIIRAYGDYAINSTININSSHIHIIGAGGDRTHDLGGQGALAATKLNWIGAGGGTMVHVFSPTGGSNQKMTQSGIEKIYFKANGAGTGLKITSQNAGKYEYLHFEEFTTSCLSIKAHTLGEAADPQLNIFKVLTCRQVLQTGAFMDLDGFANGNSSFNIFMNCSAQHRDGNAYVLNNCDNNTFIRCRSFRAAGGTGNSILSNGSDVGVEEVSRGNVFSNFTAAGGGQILAKGTTSFTFPSTNNIIIAADTENGTPVPTLETGATFWFHTNRNQNLLPADICVSLGNTLLNSRNTRDLIGSESLIIGNNASNHIAIVSTDELSIWGITIDNSTGDLRILRKTGTGNIRLDQVITYSNQTLTGSATAGVASALPATPEEYVTVELNGNLRKIPAYLV